MINMKLISKNKKQKMKSAIRRKDSSIFRRDNKNKLSTTKPNRIITPEEKEKLNKQLLEAAEKENFKSIKEALDGGADVNTQDKYGYTPLMHVSLNGNGPIADLLLQKGANKSIRNKLGAHASMYAALKGHKEITSLLDKYGATR